MLNLEFENSVLTAVRRIEKEDKSAVYITLADTSGKIVNLTVAHAPNDLEDWVLQPIRGRALNLGFLQSEKGILSVRADIFELILEEGK
jgi:hypothetical protein